MLLVLIESPYAGNTRLNHRYALAAMHDSLNRGEAPLASHLLYAHSGALSDLRPDERSRGMEAGFAWGAMAAFVAVYQDLGISNGMQIGVNRAVANGQRVEFRTVPGWIP